jgi:multisubunit Na+/H+ antiporter MnhB subunit
MKKIFSIAIVIEAASTVLFIIHMKFKPLGSDFMFAILVIALSASIFLLWQSFKNPVTGGVQKTAGIISGCLPLVWVILFILQFI